MFSDQRNFRGGLGLSGGLGGKREPSWIDFNPPGALDCGTLCTTRLRGPWSCTARYSLHCREKLRDFIVPNKNAILRDLIVPNKNARRGVYFGF